MVSFSKMVLWGYFKKIMVFQRKGKRLMCNIRVASYIGPDKELHGKKAIIRDGREANLVLAQFTNIRGPYACGSHEFPASHFSEPRKANNENS